MKIISIVSILCVAAANVCMNILVRRASLQSVAYGQALVSGSFIAALLVGTCSVLTLLWVYRQNINLSQGILLMGAASIIGGSLAGVFLFKNRLHIIEWLLLFVMAALFLFRWRSA